MILRYTYISLKSPDMEWADYGKRLCITDGTVEGEQGAGHSVFTMTLEEFNEHDWDKPLYDDVVATLLYEMPPKLKAHYDECCDGNLAYEDGDYSDEMEVHRCENCEMRYSIPVELVRDYDAVMPEALQYEHDGVDGLSPLTFLKLFKQQELF
tara:strand:+ start:475 stop:933 length:459 start_codon:yes stop_codon:yes gene_type:complete